MQRSLFEKPTSEIGQSQTLAWCAAEVDTSTNNPRELLRSRRWLIKHKKLLRQKARLVFKPTCAGPPKASPFSVGYILLQVFQRISKKLCWFAWFCVAWLRKIFAGVIVFQG